MKVFVLIIWWATGNGAAIDHIEFSSKEACQAALVQWDGEGFCADKGGVGVRVIQ